MKIVFALSINILFLILSFIAINAQTKINVYAVQLNDEITVDGILSESIWQTAPVVTGFLQLQPNEGSPASQQTFVRLAYDEHALYIGADMRDSAPDSIVSRLSRRDVMGNEDIFGVFIDSYYDRRSACYFGLSAGGTILDGILYNDDWDDNTWDGVWVGRVHHSNYGWSAEMRIPFSQLRFQRQEQYVWGINFRRDISRKNEQTYLVFRPKNSSGFVSRFADLKGIEKILPSRNIEILPYFREKAEYTHPEKDDPLHSGSAFSPIAGADVKIGLKNNLTLDMTVNPDFGQVEVDPAVVNLSDVETYFNEKRPFFIEGSSVFNFGYGGANNYWCFNWSNPNFFYSRRIGRPPEDILPDNDYSDMPEGAHIIGAVKISGKLSGNWNIGTIHAITQREYGRYALNGEQYKQEVEPASYYGIFRIQKEINDARQGIGILATRTSRKFAEQQLRNDINDHALTFGIDGWTFLDTSKTWVFTGWAGASHITGTREQITNLQANSRHYFQRPDAKSIQLDSNATALSGFAGRFYLNKQKGNIIVNSAFGIISPGFDVNDLGFLNRANLINSHFGIGYLWTKPGKVFRQCDLIGAIFQSYDFDWNSVWRGVFLLWESQFLNYIRFNTYIAYNPQTINPYRTRGGPLSLNHPGVETYFHFCSDDRKSLILSTEYYQYICTPKDKYRKVIINLECKIRSNLNMSIGPSLVQIREFAQWVDEFDDPTAVKTYAKRYVFGEMKQNEISANIRLNWTFTPQLSLQLYLQPLISHGDYKNFKELDRPKSYSFNVYPDNQILRSNGEYEIDPDGNNGPAGSFSFENPDFIYKSLRGNVILRWEYRPGSTLYLVWAQNRWNDKLHKPHSFLRSTEQLWNTKSDNILMLKITYWFSI
jgi:hypothetical protein